MLKASSAYKEAMKKKYRNHSYAIVTIGVINQVAQKNASVGSVSGEKYLYLSDKTMLFEDYTPKILYATMEENWYKADGSMYLAEPEESFSYAFNQGVISRGLLGAICIRFNASYSIKGLTIDFGPNFPVDFTVTNGRVSYTYAGNEKSYWTTSDVFEETEYLSIKPVTMSGGQNRLRIQKIYMGVGVIFDSSKIQSVRVKDFQSPITEELPTYDLTMTAENYDGTYDVSNRESTINFFEQGQEVKTSFGYELDDGSVYWMDEATTVLKSWKADKASVTLATVDKITALNQKYSGGKYYRDGITLYDLAVAVFADAGVDTRDYVLDTYLKKVKVHSPLPVVTHKECLQLIANAGRCKLYQTRDGKIGIKAAFMLNFDTERMQISSDTAEPYSDLRTVLSGADQKWYALYTEDFFSASGEQYLLPESGYSSTGFASKAISDAEGRFTQNPKVKICLEAASTFFAVALDFYRNPPAEVTLSSYKDGALKESYTVQDLELENIISHEFPEMDEIEIEFIRTRPNNKIYLSSMRFLDITDFSITDASITGNARGVLESRVKNINIVKTIFTPGVTPENLTTDTVDLSGVDEYTFTFSDPVHDVSASAGVGTSLIILRQSAYAVTVDTASLTGLCELAAVGKKYVRTQKTLVKALNSTGETVEWGNPLIGDDENALLVGDWLAAHYATNIEYETGYTGELRLDAGDIIRFQTPYAGVVLAQIYDHSLTFSGGALSGSARMRLVKEG